MKLEISPEIEAALANQARAQGLPLKDYLRLFLEGLAAQMPDPAQRRESLRDALDKLAELGQTLPHTPSSAFSRDSIYSEL